MKTRTRCLAALVLSGVLTAAPNTPIRRLDGTTISPTDIDATVSRLMAAAEVTGVGIAIFHNGKVAYLKAYGLRDAEKKLLLTADSIMAGASLTKAAFSYLVMQMVASKAIDLDKPLQQYMPKPIPDYDDYQDLRTDQRYKKLTAPMLLSHTGGFPNSRFQNPDHKLNINFEPGSRYAYSGEGIQLLQLAVESLSKKPLKELMQERVFGPLDMSRTSMVSEQRFENDYANGYDEWGRSLGHEQRQTAAAAGSMQTTLRDFARFLQAVILPEGLPKHVRELMLTPQIEISSKQQFPTLATATTEENRGIRLGYGLGWGLYWSPYGKAFFKEGHADGFRNYAVEFDKPKDGILIMTNSSNGEGIFKELMETLLRNTFTPIEWEGFTPYGELPPRKPLPKHTEVELESSLLDRLVGRYEVRGAALKVSRQGGHLLLQENQEKPGEIFPEAELRFFSKSSDDVVSFELSGEGRVTQLVIHTGGQRIPVKRTN